MIIQYEGGTCANTKDMDRACEEALKAINKELPEEARTYEVYSAVLEKCTDCLKAKRVVL